MTILAFDGKILAADSRFSCDDITIYHRSKIRIINQKAICTAGHEDDGFEFDRYVSESREREFVARNTFMFMLLATDKFYTGGAPDDKSQPITLWTPRNVAVAQGSGNATSYADGLMRHGKINAHNACHHAAIYDSGCGVPVHSITKKQLEYIDPVFDGFWIGTYLTPIKQIPKYLITYKQWLKT